MRNSKGRVLMLIIPVILLVVMIFVYREYANNQKDSNEPSITLSPAPTGMGKEEPTFRPSPVTSPRPSQGPSPTAAPVEGDFGNGNGEG